MSKPITPKQIDFIRSLAEQKLAGQVADIDAWLVDQDIYNLTLQGASELIKALQDLPAPVATDSLVPANAERVIVNRKTGRCDSCGGWVQPGKGQAALVNGAWIAVHKTAAECTAEQAPVAVADSSGVDLSVLPLVNGHGYFAVPGGDTRLKLHVRKVEAPGKWQGWFFVDDGAAYGMQTKYGRQAPGKTYQGGVVEALRAIVADPIAALQAYAGLTNHCGVCNRLLEDETSVRVGIGPVCREKLGITV